MASFYGGRRDGVTPACSTIDWAFQSHYVSLIRRLALSLFALLCAAAPAHAAGPNILVTGDSMMRGVDSRLEKELQRIQEVSFLREIRIGSALTKEPWARIASRHVPLHRPDATVVFMGANDGYDQFRAPCCGKAWIAKYESRVKKVIRIYSRDGRAQVYWLTMPAAEFGRRRHIFPKINGAIRRAVKSSGPHAHLVDAWSLFTPDGKYRRMMVWNDALLEVRSPDGVHLRPPGFQIVAELIRDAMLADGALP